METKNVTGTKAVAEKLVRWFNQGEMARCYQELYSPEIESIETGDQSEIGHLKGMDAIQKKGQWWEETFEVHDMGASEPLVADNHFSVRYHMDTTHKPSGQRSQSSEIGVYEVRDGKIVREQFFFNPG